MNDARTTYGLATQLVADLARYKRVVCPREVALSLYTIAHKRGVKVRRGRTYHRGTFVVTSEQRVSRAQTYGTNKAALLELDRAGVLIVPCGNAAECLRVAARRVGYKLSVRRIGAGPYREVRIAA